MTNLAVIENKISSVRKYLKILDEYRGVKVEELTKDVATRGVVERYLYLATQATMDLAESIIAYKGLRKPTSHKESFEILQEEKILESGLVENLKKMVGFRNILAHDYEKIDYEKVVEVMQNRLKDIEDFLKVAGKIN